MGNTTATCSEVREAPEPPTTKSIRKFDPRYKPVRIIGRGHFSTVYECLLDERLPSSSPPRRFALKVMTCWTWDSRTLKRIEEEVNIMQQLLYFQKNTREEQKHEKYDSPTEKQQQQQQQQQQHQQQHQQQQHQQYSSSSSSCLSSHPCLVKLVDYFKERIVVRLPFSLERGDIERNRKEEDMLLQHFQNHATLLMPSSSSPPQQITDNIHNISLPSYSTLRQGIVATAPTAPTGGEGRGDYYNVLLQEKQQEERIFMNNMYYAENVTATIQRETKDKFFTSRLESRQTPTTTTLHTILEKQQREARNERETIQDKNVSYMWRVGLVLDYCDGGDLAEYLSQKGPLSETECRYIICKICHGLAFLHSKRIMHRDLKPENILLGKNKGGIIMDVKISDFGLAKQLKGDLHRSLSLCGSDFYLPPEMLQQEPYDMQVDMWSMGALCFALLLGAAPFSGEDITSLYQQIIERRFSLTAEQESRISAGAWRFLLDVLQVPPGRRLTAEKALRHRWLRGSISAEELAGLPPPPPPPPFSSSYLEQESSTEAERGNQHMMAFFERAAASPTRASAAVF